MKDKKEIREISLEEEKDITSGMGVKSESIIRPGLLAYGGPKPIFNILKYGGPCIRPKLDDTTNIRNIVESEKETDK